MSRFFFVVASWLIALELPASLSSSLALAFALLSLGSAYFGRYSALVQQCNTFQITILYDGSMSGKACQHRNEANWC